MKKRPVHVAELIAGIVEAATSEGGGRRAPGRRTFEVYQAFDRLGPPLTDHAEPSSFRRGRLTLRVRSSAWLTELGMMQAQLLKRLNAGLPKPWIEEVRLVLGSPKPRPKPPPDPSPRLSPRQRELVENWSAGLENDAVREAFARAASRSLASGPVGAPPEKGQPGPRFMPIPVWVDPEAGEPELTYGYGDREVDRWKLKRRRDPEDEGE